MTILRDGLKKESLFFFGGNLQIRRFTGKRENTGRQKENGERGYAI
jgi:hypothetical protein